MAGRRRQSTSTRPRPPWSKVLYERQPFPDNYVDSDKFLDEMHRNVYTRTYNYWEICLASCSISHQLSSVLLFVVSFCYMSEEALDPSTLMAVTLSIAVLGYTTHAMRSGRSDVSSCVAELKPTALILAYSYGMSPIMKTLTQSVSTDTIYSMTFLMLSTHLFVHDYGAGTDIPVVSPPISMNAAVFAAVCLASRLPSPWHTFATLTLAMALLVFLPVLRRLLSDHYPNSSITLATLFFLLATVSLHTLSAVATTCFVLLQLVVVFVCPHIYCHMQCYKNNIHGPWDEALPDTTAAPQTPDERGRMSPEGGGTPLCPDHLPTLEQVVEHTVVTSSG